MDFLELLLDLLLWYLDGLEVCRGVDHQRLEVSLLSSGLHGAWGLVEQIGDGGGEGEDNKVSINDALNQGNVLVVLSQLNHEIIDLLFVLVSGLLQMGEGIHFFLQILHLLLLDDFALAVFLVVCIQTDLSSQEGVNVVLHNSSEVHIGFLDHFDEFGIGDLLVGLDKLIHLVNFIELLIPDVHSVSHVHSVS